MSKNKLVKFAVTEGEKRTLDLLIRKIDPNMSHADLLEFLISYYVDGHLEEIEKFNTITLQKARSRLKEYMKAKPSYPH